MAQQTTEKPELASVRKQGEEYLALWARIEALHAEAKALEEQADAVENRMVEELLGAGEKVCHLDGVGRFQLDPQLFVQVLAENKPEVVAWLKGDPDGSAIVTEDVNHQRMKAFIKERLKQGKPIHELVKVTPVTQIKFVPAK